MHGKIFGEIASIVHETPYMVYTPALRNYRVLVNNAREMDAWNDACWALVENLAEYPTGENLFEAYWRTLICNTVGAGLEASKKLEFAYRTWIGLFVSLIEGLEIGRPFIEEPIKNDSPAPSSTWEGIRGLGTKISTSWKLFTMMMKMSWKAGVMTQQEKSSAPFEKAFKRYSFGRKFFTTTNGYMGWLPSEVRKDDRICYFDGCKLPFVIRPCEGRYELVGDCYLHGLMHDPPQGLDMSMLETIILI